MHVLLIGLCKCMHVTVTATGSGQNRPLWFEPEVEMISVQSYRLRQSCSKSQVYLYLSYHARRPPHLPHRHYILREHQSKDEMSYCTISDNKKKLFGHKSDREMTQSMTDEFGLADAMKQIATFKSKDLRFMTLKSLELKGLGKQDSAAIHSRIWLCCILTGHPRLVITDAVVEKVGAFITDLLRLRQSRLSDQDYDKLSRLLNTTILSIENCSHGFDEATRSGWIWKFLFAPLLSAAKESQAIHSSEVYNWVRSALWIVKQHTGLPALPLAQSCISALSSLPVTGAPGIFLLLQECLGIAAHHLGMKDRRILLKLCLKACQQPKACFLLKWQSLSAIQQLTRTEEDGATSLEVATVFSTGSTLPNTLQKLLFDQHPLVRSAAKEATMAICSLCESAKKALQERSGASDSGDPCIQSQESAEEGHKEQGPVASDKESKNAPTGRQPAKWRLDVVIPPPLPAKVERTRKQLIASSKKCQPAAAGPSTNDEPIGCSERESGISEAGSQAEESLPVSIPASQTGCHHSRGTSSKASHQHSTSSQSAEVSDKLEEDSMDSNQTGFFRNIISNATSCFTGGQGRRRASKARKSSDLEAEVSSSQSSASLTDSHSSGGSQHSRSSFKRAAKFLFPHILSRKGSRPESLTPEELQAKYESPSAWPQCCV